MLTPGFRSPSGPAFPSHPLLSHTLGLHSVWRGCSLDGSSSLRMDVACPGVIAVISLASMLAQRTRLAAVQKLGKKEDACSDLCRN